jgi:hypothetical protein
LDEVRHLGVDHAHHLVDDEQVEVARDHHRVVAESCGHRQERYVDQSTAVCQVVARVCQAWLVVVLQVGDW